MKGLYIASSYFKKSRFQIIMMALMILLASFVMGLALKLAIDYHDNYYRTHDRLNAEHITIDFADLGISGKEELIEKIKTDDRITEYAVSDILVCNGNCQFGKDGLLIASFLPMRFSDTEELTVGRYEIVDEGSEGDGYVPYIFSHYYKIGDTFTVSTEGAEISFQIKGFYNNLTTGTVNCKTVVLLLNDDTFEQFNASGLKHGYHIGLRLTTPEEAERIEPDLIMDLSSVDPFLVFTQSTNYAKLSLTRYISEKVFVGVLFAASFVILAVLLSVIAFSLTNYVKENMHNFGILKALGYASSSLTTPINLSLLLLALGTSIIGCGLSYFILPTINSILEGQSGIPYTIRFLLLPDAITIGSIVLLVFLTSAFSMLKIRVIQPITAIRPMQMSVHNVLPLPLHQRRMELNLALGLKTIFSDIKKYIVFLLTACLITIMLCVAIFCSDNILYHPERIFRFIFGNTADIMVRVNSTDEEALTSWLNNQDEVELQYLLTQDSACHVDGGKIDVAIRDEEGFNQCEYLLLNGSFPITESELALNYVYAEKYGLEIGDSMTLSSNGNEKSYIISGIIQDASYSGRNLLLTREGYEKLTALYSLTIMVNLKDVEDVDAFINRIGEVFKTAGVINYRKYINGMSSNYIVMLNAMISVIIIVSVLISILVLSIIVNMILFNKRREHGILKSLGFVTSQIIFQTAVSFVPVALLGAVLGLLISRDGVSALFSYFVRDIGISSFGESVQTLSLLLCGLGFTLFTFMVTCFLSGKVRKTVPHDLFNNE